MLGNFTIVVHYMNDNIIWTKGPPTNVIGMTTNLNERITNVFLPGKTALFFNCRNIVFAMHE